MGPTDLEPVIQIEAISNPVPWKENHFNDFISPPALDARALRAWVFADPEVKGFICVSGVLDELEIQELAVAPDHRCKNIAGRLLERVISWATQQGFSHIHLEVRTGNVAAKTLYSRFSFQQNGKRKGYYSDNGEDADLMRLNL